jgi:broad specificity phosphatase PhoE
VSSQGQKLILVRHSLPAMVTGVPASKWHLSVEGRRRCTALAGRLAAFGLAAIVSSREPKAVETGQIVAGTLGLPLETAPGLHERERGPVKDLGNQEDFQAQVARFFEHPDQLVLGYETADEAHARFTRAIAAAIERRPAINLAIVSHGTVMTLFVARATGLDPVPFWKGLGLPSFVVLSLPELALLEVVTDVAAAGPLHN